MQRATVATPLSTMGPRPRTRRRCSPHRPTRSPIPMHRFILLRKVLTKIVFLACQGRRPIIRFLRPLMFCTNWAIMCFEYVGIFSRFELTFLKALRQQRLFFFNVLEQVFDVQRQNFNVLKGWMQKLSGRISMFWIRILILFWGRISMIWGRISLF